MRSPWDPTTDEFAVVWYDTRLDSPTYVRTNLYGTILSPYAAPFMYEESIAIGPSDATTAMSPMDYGDYIGVCFYGGVFHPAWSDNSATGGPFSIYTASVTVRLGH